MNIIIPKKNLPMIKKINWKAIKNILVRIWFIYVEIWEKCVVAITKGHFQVEMISVFLAESPFLWFIGQCEMRESSFSMHGQMVN
jgi:hypothetical protein